MFSPPPHAKPFGARVSVGIPQRKVRGTQTQAEEATPETPQGRGGAKGMQPPAEAGVDVALRWAAEVLGELRGRGGPAEREDSIHVGLCKIRHADCARLAGGVGRLKGRPRVPCALQCVARKVNQKQVDVIHLQLREVGVNRSGGGSFGLTFLFLLLCYLRICLRLAILK